MKQEKTITHPQPPSGGLGGANTSSFGLFLKGGIIVLQQRFDGPLGGIQVLRHQRGGWVGSENGNF